MNFDRDDKVAPLLRVVLAFHFENAQDRAVPIIKLIPCTYNNMRQPQTAIDVTHKSTILVLPQTQKIKGEKIACRILLSNRLHDKILRIQKLWELKFAPNEPWIQNLRRHNQNGQFLFQIRPPVCRPQNQSGTKTFRIRHESRTISTSVNVTCKPCCTTRIQ